MKSLGNQDIFKIIKLLTMYMRYHPRELKPINRMQTLLPDRGKKHYWGYDKGDYGIYTTEDQQYMRNLSRGHKRSHTVDNSSMNRFEVINPESILQKSVVKFADPEEIKLPSISRVSRQTQTSFNNPQKRVGTAIKTQERQEQLRTSRNEQMERQRRHRYHTENFSQNQMFHNQIRFDPSTRFSPTFVCSVLNPLPSYIIQPHQYRSRDYTRVQSERIRPSLRKYEKY